MYIGQLKTAILVHGSMFQAVDQFSNRVDNGRTHTMAVLQTFTFRTPGLLAMLLVHSSSADKPLLIVCETKTSSICCSRYIRAPASIWSLPATTLSQWSGFHRSAWRDVVRPLNLALPGVRAPLASGATGLFPSIPAGNDCNDHLLACSARELLRAGCWSRLALAKQCF